MEFMTVKEASAKWGVTTRWIHMLCKDNRIEGVKRIGNMWVIPVDSQKPRDARFKIPKSDK